MGSGGVNMIKTFEAMIDQQGNIRLMQPVHLPKGRRALVTVLEEVADFEIAETALLSEAALAEDWNREEEDRAWAHLQSAASS
jgi:hypothetical protein